MARTHKKKQTESKQFDWKSLIPLISAIILLIVELLKRF